MADYLNKLLALPVFKAGDLVVLSPDEDHGTENGTVLYQSTQDPLLYLVLVSQAQDKFDHRHRLVSRDCMDPA